MALPILSNFIKAKSKERFPRDIIRCDEQEYVFWKWTSAAKPNTTNRENYICCKSNLVVRKGEVAIFFYRNNAAIYDLVEGPYDQPINEIDFPVLARLERSPFGREIPFQADVYFVKTSCDTCISLGVHYFNVYDSLYPNLGVQCGVRRTLEFSITDYRKFITLNHLNRLDPIDLKNRLDNYLTFRAKDAILGFISRNNLDITKLDSKLEAISNLLHERFASPLFTEFGITLKHFKVISMQIDKEHPNYLKLGV